MSSTKNPVHRLFRVDAAEHGRVEAVEPDDNVNLQVINLGLSRTGTTTISAALEILGFGPCHQGVDLFRNPALTEGWISILKDMNAGRTSKGPALSARIRYMLRGYQSSCDHPVNQIPAEVVATYPNANYILSVRDGGSQEWWKSFDGAVGVHFRNDWSHFVFMTLIYPVSFLRRMTVNVEQHRIMWLERFGSVDEKLYDKHNAMVKELVPKDRLLEFNVKQGWEPLCRFLDVPVPEQPFPKLNEQGSMKAIYFGMQMFGACTWAAYIGLAAGGTYLVARPEVGKRILSGAIGLVSSLQRRLRQFG